MIGIFWFVYCGVNVAAQKGDALDGEPGNKNIGEAIVSCQDCQLFHLQ